MKIDIFNQYVKFILNNPEESLNEAKTHNINNYFFNGAQDNFIYYIFNDDPQIYKIPNILE